MLHRLAVAVEHERVIRVLAERPLKLGSDESWERHRALPPALRLLVHRSCPLLEYLMDPHHAIPDITRTQAECLAEPEATEAEHPDAAVPVVEAVDDPHSLLAGRDVQHGSRRAWQANDTALLAEAGEWRAEAPIVRHRRDHAQRRVDPLHRLWRERPAGVADAATLHHVDHELARRVPIQLRDRQVAEQRPDVVLDVRLVPVDRRRTEINLP